MSRTDRPYSRLYARRQHAHAYPNEFAIRTFLGGYSSLPQGLRNPRKLRGARILDLGCGDGRNMPLFRNLGMKISGTEVTAEACEGTQKRMCRLGIACDLRVGRSNCLPFKDESFDIVFASGVLSFVDEGDRFADNLPEPHRVLRKAGHFVFYVLMPTSSQIRSSLPLGGGAYRVRRDPFGRIDGMTVKTFRSESEIRNALRPFFRLESAGSSRVDVYGDFSIEVWWCVATRRQTKR